MAEDAPVVAVTRPKPKIPRTERVLMARGLEPLAAPTLEIRPFEDPALERVLDDVAHDRLDAVVFTGATGVRHAADQVEEAGYGGLADLLEGSAVVAIGPRTASALERAGVDVHAVPDTHSSAGLVRWFEEGDPAGDQVALLRSTRGTNVLPKGLRDLGVEVREAHVYDLGRPDPDETHDRLFETVVDGDVDGYTFTSSLTVEHFLSLADEVGPGREAAVDRLNVAAVATIGEPTAGTLEEAGVPVDVVPDEARIQALADDLADLLGVG